MWLLSFLLGTYFGDSKKNTEDGRVRGQRVEYDENQVKRVECFKEGPADGGMYSRFWKSRNMSYRGYNTAYKLTYVGIFVVFDNLPEFKVAGHDR